MRDFWKVGMCVGVFSLAGLMPACTTLAAEEEEAVSEANTQFYSALNAMFTGDVNPMEEVWSHADDVTYMGPTGGIQVGWDQVLAYWQRQASRKLGGEVRPETLQINAGPDIAVVCGYEEGENIINNVPQKVSIRATNTYRKENGQSKMIGHHTDLLPYLEQ